MEVSFTYAQNHLDLLWDKAIENQEIILIEKPGKPRIAMMTEAELAGIMETLYLFQSPKNATRLLSALDGARNNEGEADSIDNLAQRLGL